MDVRELTAALQKCYNTNRVQIEVNGKCYDIQRVIKQSDVFDWDENDVIILKAVTE